MFFENMDNTNKNNTEIYKDEEHGQHHQKHSTEIYKDEQHGRHHQKT
jgi:quinol monooxygenase YgiN